MPAYSAIERKTKGKAPPERGLPFFVSCRVRSENQSDSPPLKSKRYYDFMKLRSTVCRMPPLR